MQPATTSEVVRPEDASSSSSGQTLIGSSTSRAAASSCSSSSSDGTNGSPPNDVERAESSSLPEGRSQRLLEADIRRCESLFRPVQHNRICRVIETFVRSSGASSPSVNGQQQQNDMAAAASGSNTRTNDGSSEIVHNTFWKLSRRQMEVLEETQSYLRRLIGCFTGNDDIGHTEGDLINCTCSNSRNSLASDSSAPRKKAARLPTAVQNSLRSKLQLHLGRKSIPNTTSGKGNGRPVLSYPTKSEIKVSRGLREAFDKVIRDMRAEAPDVDKAKLEQQAFSIMKSGRWTVRSGKNTGKRSYSQEQQQGEDGFSTFALESSASDEEETARASSRTSSPTTSAADRGSRSGRSESRESAPQSDRRQLTPPPSSVPPKRSTIENRNDRAKEATLIREQDLSKQPSASSRQEAEAANSAAGRNNVVGEEVAGERRRSSQRSNKGAPSLWRSDYLAIEDMGRNGKRPKTSKLATAVASDDPVTHSQRQGGRAPASAAPPLTMMARQQQQQVAV